MHVPVILNYVAEHNPRDMISIVKKPAEATFDSMEASGASKHIKDIREGILKPIFALEGASRSSCQSCEISPRLDAEKMGLFQPPI
jgi:hypothetical protein